jgi:hypothetical protein
MERAERAERADGPCRVPGCDGTASAFVLNGEVYLGRPQHRSHVGLCARHAGQAAGTDVRRPVAAR